MVVGIGWHIICKFWQSYTDFFGHLCHLNVFLLHVDLFAVFTVLSTGSPTVKAGIVPV